MNLQFLGLLPLSITITGVKEAGEKSFSGFPQFLKFIFSFIDIDDNTVETSRSLVNIETKSSYWNTSVTIDIHWRRKCS
jgi:hypothetical protein